MPWETWEEEGDLNRAAVLKQPLPSHWQNPPKSQTDGPFFFLKYFLKKKKRGTTNETAPQIFIDSDQLSFEKLQLAKLQLKCGFCPVNGYFLSAFPRTHCMLLGLLLGGAGEGPPVPGTTPRAPAGSGGLPLGCWHGPDRGLQPRARAQARPPFLARATILNIHFSSIKEFIFKVLLPLLDHLEDILGVIALTKPVK